MTREERMATPADKMGKADLRGYIRRRMQEEGISVYKLADILGVARANLQNGLNGRIPIPLERVETILWILDGERFV